VIDPITVFAACKAAHSGIKQCVELYQEFKQDGKDISGIVTEISQHLGKFFSHHEEFKVAEKESQKTPLPKNISINEEAMNRVLRQEQMQQMETELREMIIYQVGMPGLWSKFAEMRDVVRKEREKVEREQKKYWQKLRTNVNFLLKSTKFEQPFALQF
jgi:predicted AlkP superfamily phosphohydrolase/phosphomutase